MRVKEISASRTCKVNLGNYEAQDVTLSATAEVDEMEDEDKALVKLDSMIEDAMLDRLDRLHSARGKAADRREVAKRHGLKFKEKKT